MSHFPVLVVVPDGKELDEVMMPFHEFECTGIDQYIQEIDITEQARVEGLDYFGLEDRVISDESEIDRSDKHKYGYAIVQNGLLVKAIDRTNPNKKWDWYTIGGRWSKYFGIYSGTKAQFNFDSVRLNIVNEKLSRLSKFQEKRREASVTGYEIDQASELLNGRWKDNKKAHALYRHPVDLALDRKAFNALDWYSWTADTAEQMRQDAEQYKANHEYDALLHAFIDASGNWHEVGDMGWWGMCLDENKDTFNGEHGEFWTFINSLPDDTMLYVVDCHI